jgi:hypothetical protein
LQQDEALPYATCLAQVAETAVWPRRPMTAPGAFITRRAMSIRIERLLAKQRDVRIHTSLVPAGSAFIVLAVLGLIATIVSPSLAYDAGSVPTTTAVATAAPPAAPLRILKSTNVHAEANDPSFIDELDKLGYKNISVDDLVSLRSIGVTTDYLRGLERAGVPRPSVEDLIEMRSLGIEPAYYRAMLARLPKLSVDDLYGLRTSGVTPEYIDRLRHDGYHDITIERLEEFEATGITAEYIAGLSQAGYRNLSDDEIAQLHALGVDGAFVRKANGHGLHHLSIDDLTKLKASGVL